MQNSTAQNIRAARGEIPADLVLKGAKILNVFTGEWLAGDVAVCGSQIVGIGTYSGEQETDVSGKYIVPGFIDAHVHIESSMLTPSGFIGEILPWGTTTILADPHELANVAGIPGVTWVLEQAEHLPCNLFVMLPSCVPSTPFEHNGAVLTAKELAAFKNHPAVLGLGEMMDAPGVLAQTPAVLEKLEAFQDKMIDGHGPMLSGSDLQAYRTAGVCTDHECTTAQEVLEKLRAGFAILVREGSGAQNLDDLLLAVKESGLGYSRLTFCTDDKHVEDIRKNGHICNNIAKAIRLGVPQADAYRMASWNTAQIYGLRGLGAVAAGYQADFAVLDDPETVTVHSVFYKGKQYTQGNTIQTPIPSSADFPPPPQLLNTVHPAPVTLSDFAIPCTGNASIIELIPNQILTKHCSESVPCRNGAFYANETYQKIAVLERHHQTGNIGLGIVKGFHLQGALASTVAHDSHNLIVIGSSDADMLLAVETLKACGGGYAAVQNGAILALAELPVCGLLTTEPADSFNEKLKHVSAAAQNMGIAPQFDPFQTLSFLALPVLPEIRITDCGLFDVIHSRFIPQNEKV